MDNLDFLDLEWEQLLALRIIRDKPDQECTEIAEQAGCSWAELILLGNKGFVDMGADRLKRCELHPVLTPKGVIAVEQAEGQDLI